MLFHTLLKNESINKALIASKYTFIINHQQSWRPNTPLHPSLSALVALRPFQLSHRQTILLVTYYHHNQLHTIPSTPHSILSITYVCKQQDLSMRMSYQDLLMRTPSTPSTNDWSPPWTPTTDGTHDSPLSPSSPDPGAHKLCNQIPTNPTSLKSAVMNSSTNSQPFSSMPHVGMHQDQTYLVSLLHALPFLFHHKPLLP